MTISRSLVFLACGLALGTFVVGCTQHRRATDRGVAATAGTGAVTPTTPPQAAWPPAPPMPDEFMAQAALEDVHFDFDTSNIRSDAARILERSAEWLLEHPGYVVVIEGHGDTQGTSEYNLALGDLRAQRTREYLVARGVAGARFSTISYGEERPACAERGDTCWSRNRRVRLLVKAQ